MTDQIEAWQNLLEHRDALTAIPIGTYDCVALHDGREVQIQQAPIVTKQGRPV